MKGLADYVHDLGLRIGIYSSPGPTTCGGCLASYQHEDQDAQSYADWGIDYLKYDWCSYGGTSNVNRSGRSPNSLPVLQEPYALMHSSLLKVNRDILFSLCQYGNGNVWRWGAEVGGNSWRTTGDITDTWQSLSNIGFSQDSDMQHLYAGPGHFNDPDMLIVGKVGWGNLHSTRLSPNEQYTHISLWSLLAAPLLIGCDMTQLDDFTTGLLSNDDVLAVDQDALGHAASRIAQTGDPATGFLEIWAKDLADGSKAVGLFNRGDDNAPVTATWSDLGLSGRQTVRDLWRQKDLGQFSDKFQATVPYHGVVLVKISPAK